MSHAWSVAHDAGGDSPSHSRTDLCIAQRPPSYDIENLDGHVMASSLAVAVGPQVCMRFSFSAFASCLTLVLLARQVPPLTYERLEESYAASAPGQHDVSSGMSAMHPS